LAPVIEIIRQRYELAPAAGPKFMRKEGFAMRHLLADWNRWSLPERIAAVTLALGAVMVPAAFAIA